MICILNYCLGSKSDDSIFPGLLLHLGWHGGVFDRCCTGERAPGSIDRVQVQP